eukprot:scaffold2248_cov133-Isochrysis_galbana.AAC.5
MPNDARRLRAQARRGQSARGALRQAAEIVWAHTAEGLRGSCVKRRVAHHASHLVPSQAPPLFWFKGRGGYHSTCTPGTDRLRCGGAGSVVVPARVERVSVHSSHCVCDVVPTTGHSCFNVEQRRTSNHSLGWQSWREYLACKTDKSGSSVADYLDGMDLGGPHPQAPGYANTPTNI